MASGRVIRPQAELDLDARTLFYELDGLIGTAEKLQALARPRSPDERIAYNALVESFAVHSRCLIHFFYSQDNTVFKQGRKGGDIVALDYLPPDLWETICPAISDELRRAKTNADKQIAHMTVDRRDIYDTNTGEKTWYSGAVATELSSIMEAFLNCKPAVPLNVQAEIRQRIHGMRCKYLSASTVSVAPTIVHGGPIGTAATIPKPIGPLRPSTFGRTE